MTEASENYTAHMNRLKLMREAIETDQAEMAEVAGGPTPIRPTWRPKGDARWKTKGDTHWMKNPKNTNDSIHPMVAKELTDAVCVCLGVDPHGD